MCERESGHCGEGKHHRLSLDGRGDPLSGSLPLLEDGGERWDDPHGGEMVSERPPSSHRLVGKKY